MRVRFSPYEQVYVYEHVQNNPKKKHKPPAPASPPGRAALAFFCLFAMAFVTRFRASSVEAGGGGEKFIIFGVEGDPQ